jgi:hypothetical protein
MDVKEGEDIPVQYTPWVPMTRKIDIKHIGKLGEEAGELATVCCRCIIQGIDEPEPVTKKINRVWLEDEIADVLTNIELVIAHFKLDGPRMIERARAKAVMLKAWHESLNDT